MAEPESGRLGDSLWVIWKSRALTFEFLIIRETNEGIAAELTVRGDEQGEVFWGRLNLASGQSRAAVAKHIEATVPVGLSVWRTLLEQSCREVIRLHRTPAPVVDLALHPEAPPQLWLVPWLIPLDHTSILFGDGGATKSLTALALALAGMVGVPLGGHPAWRVAAVKRVLYLDWEGTADTQRERLHGLARSLGVTTPTECLYYQPMHSGFVDQLPAVRRLVNKHAIDLLIVDSLAPASGAEPESSDAAVRTMMALRGLGQTRIVVAHVSKVAADSAGPARPFGSVFVQNLARSTIEVRRTGDGPEASVTLYHRKSNFGRLMDATALTYSFSPGRIDCRPAQPDLSAASLSTRILDALASNHPESLSYQALSDMIGSTPESIRKATTRSDTRSKLAFHSGSDRKTLISLVKPPGVAQSSNPEP